MTITRQDNWSADDDLTLAKTTIEYIKTGKTQLEAFEVTGKQLNRTPAACGFRWNSFLRKQYADAVSDAKTIRMELKGRQASSSHRDIDLGNTDINIDSVLKYLVLIKQELNNLNRENKDLREKLSSANTLTDNDVQKMFKVLQQVIKTQENEKEMPTG
ncbi:RsfA family transcriptional regulator [Paenibacillus sp. FSL H3-0333]|uniref:RsfA family transcriptional regulator n=1 Tax=Paenibacillus sp. FSL H3-0333 TaxID=2921373 RepID=UPI0030F6AF24